MNKTHYIIFSKVPPKSIYIVLTNFVRKTSNKFRLLSQLGIGSVPHFKMLLSVWEKSEIMAPVVFYLVTAIGLLV